MCAVYDVPTAIHPLLQMTMFVQTPRFRDILPEAPFEREIVIAWVKSHSGTIFANKYIWLHNDYSVFYSIEPSHPRRPSHAHIQCGSHGKQS